MKKSIPVWVMRFIWFFLLVQALAVLGFSVWVSPDDIESGAVQIREPCPALIETGIPCATCGVTRGLCAMGHLQWVRAYNYNPIAVWLFLGECVVVFFTLRRRPWRKKKSETG